MNRYVVKAPYEVGALPDGVARHSTGAWVVDTNGSSPPIWFPHIADAHDKARAWNRRYAAGLTT